MKRDVPPGKGSMGVVQLGDMTVQRERHLTDASTPTAHTPSPSIGPVVLRSDTYHFNYPSHS